MESRSVEFSKSFEEASPSTPIFFILSPGVNPLKVNICICFQKNTAKVVARNLGVKVQQKGHKDTDTDTNKSSDFFIYSSEYFNPGIMESLKITEFL